MEKGSYVLVIELGEEKEVEVGVLGDLKLNKGFYFYTGSAFGPGGFSRVSNHVKIANGKKERQRWHIDYLLSLKSASISKVFLTSENVECDLAQAIELLQIESFGCSDCECGSHLFYSRSSEGVEEVERAFEQETDEFNYLTVKKFKEMF